MAATIQDTSPSESGLKIMDPLDEMPLLPGMVGEEEEEEEANSSTTKHPEPIRRIELLDDEEDCPVPPAAMLEDSVNSNSAVPSIKTIAPREYIDNDDTPPPVPFNYAEFEDEDTISKRNASEMRPNTVQAGINNHTGKEDEHSPSTLQAPDRGGDSIYVPTNEDMEAGERQANINTVDGTGTNNSNRRGWGDILSRLQPPTHRAGIPNDEEEGGESATDEHSHNSFLRIPEAWAVSSVSSTDSSIGETYFQSVYDAVLALPWWRQRMVMVLLGLMFVSLAAMAIALGVSLGMGGGSDSENTAVLSVKLSLPPTVCPASFVF